MHCKPGKLQRYSRACAKFYVVDIYRFYSDLRRVLLPQQQPVSKGLFADEQAGFSMGEKKAGKPAKVRDMKLDGQA